MFKGTSFPGRLRWLILPLPVMVLALAFGQGTASAANPPSGAVGNGVNKFDYTGQVLMSNSAFMPGGPGTFGGSQCPDPTLDAVTCDNFVLNTTQAGTATSCITFDDPFTTNELDIWVVDVTPGSPTNGKTIAFNDATPTSYPVTKCTAPFSVVMNGHYDVLVGGFVLFPPQTYTGEITFQASGGGQNSCFKMSGKHMEGGGRTHHEGQDDDDHRGKYHYKSHRDDKTGQQDGSFRYRDDAEGYNFYSMRVDSIQYQQIGTPLTPIWKLTATGAGVNNGNAVTFTITSISEGLQGAGDTFVIQTSDGKVGGGQVASGQNNYLDYGD